MKGYGALGGVCYGLLKRTKHLCICGGRTPEMVRLMVPKGLAAGSTSTRDTLLDGFTRSLAPIQPAEGKDL